MSIRRAKRPDRFTTISNDVFNSTLSFRAMGLLTYLLSKPENWEVSVAHLVKASAQTDRPEGRDSIYAILNELIKHRYVVRTLARNGGKMNGYDYEVFDEPQPDQDMPYTSGPCPAVPYTAEPTQIKTEHQQVPKVQSTDIATPSGAALTGELIDAEPRSESSIQEQCREVWKAYSRAYQGRYGVEPVRNAKINAQVKQLVQRLGAEAPDVAEFYVLSVNDAFIVRGVHDLGLMLSRCEAYRTQWATGRSMTATRAKQVDQTQANYSAADEAMALIQKRRGMQHAQ